MWDYETNLDYLSVVSGEKKKLLDRTCSKFLIPLRGLALLFDRCNYEDYPEKSIWHNLGIHMNIALGDDRNRKSPEPVEIIIKSKNYAHLIWLSQRAWDASQIDFVWNLSHELRHFEQDVENRAISLAYYFLKWCFSNFNVDIEEPKIHTVFPPEKDAELAAWRITRQVIDAAEVDSYVHDNAKKGDKKDIFQDLLNYDPDKEYDVCNSTLYFLKKYKPQFENYFNSGPEYYIDEIGSIDDLCSELSNKSFVHSQSKIDGT
jgi:hypothetical protein